MSAIGKIISGYFREKARTYASAGEWMKAEYPKGSFGYARSVLLYSTGELFREISEAFAAEAT